MQLNARPVASSHGDSSRGASRRSSGSSNARRRPMSVESDGSFYSPPPDSSACVPALRLLLPSLRRRLYLIPHRQRMQWLAGVLIVLALILVLIVLYALPSVPAQRPALVPFSTLLSQRGGSMPHLPMLVRIYAAPVSVSTARHQNAESMCARMAGVDPSGRLVHCALAEWNAAEEKEEGKRASDLSVVDAWKTLYGTLRRWEVSVARATYRVFTSALYHPTSYRSLVFLEDDAMIEEGFEHRIHMLLMELADAGEQWSALSFFSGACDKLTVKLGLSHAQLRAGSQIYRVASGFRSWWSYNVAVAYSRDGLERMLAAGVPSSEIDMHIADLIRDETMSAFITCPNTAEHAFKKFKRNLNATKNYE